MAEREQAIQLSDTTSSFPFMYKIDMYGSFFLLWMIWEVPFMLRSFQYEHAIVNVPFELLLHSPIVLNPAVDVHSESRLTCNTHFATFLKTPEFLTDDFMGDVLTKAKSEGFLSVMEVNYTFMDLRNHTSSTQIRLALRLQEVCEVTEPLDIIGGCFSYEKVFESCLNSSCGDRLFLCWWQPLNLLRFVLIGHVGLFLPGVLVMLLTMFDPPPAGFWLVARPSIVGISYCTSSALAFLYMSLALALIANYLEQPVFFSTYASEDNRYQYFYGSGFILISGGACVNFIFGCCYLYVSFFSPAYPRMKESKEGE